MPEPPSRRTVLRVLAVGGLGVLAACELPRPDEDAGQGHPTGSPAADRPGTAPAAAEVADVPDGPALEAAFRRAGELAALARRVRPRPLVRTAWETLATQQELLRQLLEAAAVAVPAPAPTGEPLPAGEQQEEPRAQPRRLALELRADAGRAALQELATVSSANLAMLTALTAHRGALATLLEQPPPWDPLAGPTGQPAAAMLGSFRPAVYAFEVLAARTGGGERESFETTLSDLRRVTRVLTELAGPAAPPAPLGYGLSDRLGSPEARRALARDALAALPAAVVRDAGGHTGDTAAVAGTVQVLATALALGHEWDAPLTAFPGMRLP